MSQSCDRPSFVLAPCVIHSFSASPGQSTCVNGNSHGECSCSKMSSLWGQTWCPHFCPGHLSWLLCLVSAQNIFVDLSYIVFIKWPWLLGSFCIHTIRAYTVKCGNLSIPNVFAEILLISNYAIWNHPWLPSLQSEAKPYSCPQVGQDECL
jgi:hypothetical protein